MSVERRDALLRRNEDEYVLLRGMVERLRGDGRAEAEFDGDARDRTVRDVLAHLHAWHLLLEDWHAEGMAGGTPAIPAEGYTWRDLDALNLVLRDRWAGSSLDAVAALLDESHARLQRMIAAHDDGELFDATAYPWTGGSELGEFCLECGGNHYAWGRAAISQGLGDPDGR